jgi:hypothetical protein
LRPSFERPGVLVHGSEPGCFIEGENVDVIDARFSTELEDSPG